MTFAKPDKKSDDFDDDSHRFCSYPGCQNLWSVKIDKRLCSHHAWRDSKPVNRPIAKPLPEPKPITYTSWHDDKTKDVF
jgi:hypothetical protein